MTVITEGGHDIAFIVREQGYISREEVVIVSGQNLVGGAVVGKITASGKYAAYDNAAATGVETAAGILLYATNAAAGDKKATILKRLAEVNEGELVFTGGMSAGDKTAAKADLVALNIICRAN